MLALQFGLAPSKSCVMILKETWVCVYVCLYVCVYVCVCVTLTLQGVSPVKNHIGAEAARDLF